MRVVVLLSWGLDILVRDVRKTRSSGRRRLWTHKSVLGVVN